MPPLAPGADPYYTLYQGSLSAQWQIDLFGRVRRQSEAAQAQIYASEQGRRARRAVADHCRGGGLRRRCAVSTGSSRSPAPPPTTTPGRRSIFDLRFKGGAASQVEVQQVESQYQLALARSRARAAGGGAGEPAVDPARAQPGADRARQGSRPARALRRSPATCRRRCWSDAPTSCRPSRTWSRPTPSIGVAQVAALPDAVADRGAGLGQHRARRLSQFRVGGGCRSRPAWPGRSSPSVRSRARCSSAEAAQREALPATSGWC